MRFYDRVRADWTRKLGAGDSWTPAGTSVLGHLGGFDTRRLRAPLPRTDVMLRTCPGPRRSSACSSWTAPWAASYSTCPWCYPLSVAPQHPGLPLGSPISQHQTEELELPSRNSPPRPSQWPRSDRLVASTSHCCAHEPRTRAGAAADRSAPPRSATSPARMATRRPKPSSSPSRASPRTC